MPSLISLMHIHNMNANNIEIKSDEHKSLD